MSADVYYSRSLSSLSCDFELADRIGRSERREKRRRLPANGYMRAAYTYGLYHDPSFTSLFGDTHLDWEF
jgi:hypothetical protein